MDLQKIMTGIENSAELIKQIEAELGKEFVPRTEFNAKNEALKAAEKQLGELNASLADIKKASDDKDLIITDLTTKNTKHELSSLKAKIAHEKGIPYDLVDRLQGEDEKTIGADADKLAGLLSSQNSSQPFGGTEPNKGDQGDPNKQAYKSLLTELRGE